MRSIQPVCFTRVVLDGVEGVEIAQLHSVEQRIRECLPHVSEAERLYIGGALLNLALERMLSSPGTHDATSAAAESRTRNGT